MELSTIVKVLLVNEDGEVLFLRRSPTDTRRPGQWDLPGGNVERGEDIQAALIRETAEESGIAIHRPVVVFAISEPRPPFGYPSWIFCAEKVRGRAAVGLSYEHDAYQWMTIREAVKCIEYDLHRHMLQYVQKHALLDILP